ncbi:MAG: hypothetical protein CSA33_06295 [Desulfobulbus propionicus]|nr:MAG: hypothetical protein CSA33_06295 [Desulfobulbus propionicus]
MRITFNEISSTGYLYECRELNGVITDQEILSFGHVTKAALRLVKKNDQQIELSGVIQAVPEVVCDRCLESYGCVIDTTFHLLFEVAGTSRWQVHELECDAQQMDTIELHEPSIDLDDVLRQQILLSLPVKKICASGCKGICSHCGANLNREPCQCTVKAGNSPFAILAEYKKKEK